MIANKNYYRDADHNLVEEDDPKAAFLVAGKGTEIPKETVEKYGIDQSDDEEEKSNKKPKASGNKSAAPSENKSKAK